MNPAFLLAFALVIGVEGGFSIDPNDPGNYTPDGRLLGTKYGIAARDFPTLDIANLTLDQARSIYFALYWTKAGCDRLPQLAAIMLFDSAVNNGVGRAIRFLQAAVGVVEDGLWGTASQAALTAALGNGSPDRVAALAGEFQARRIIFMAALSTWPTFGLGWARRLAQLPLRAATGASA